MSPHLSLEERKTLVRTYLEHAWSSSEGQECLQPEIGAPSKVSVGGDPLPFSPQQLRMMARSAFPDLRFIINTIMAEGEMVVVRWLLQGTDLGGVEGHEPTGRRVELTGVAMMHIEQQAIVEEWVEVDLAGMFRQLGFMYVPRPARITTRRPSSFMTL